jgi:hypothetical protein
MIDKTGRSLASSRRTVLRTVGVAGLAATFGSGAVVAQTDEGGEEQWAFETGSVVDSPTVADGTVFVGSTDNTLYAVDTGVAGSSERGETGTGGNNTGESESESGDSVPGFGIGGATSALGATGYMLKRQLTDDTE